MDRNLFGPGRPHWSTACLYQKTDPDMNNACAFPAAELLSALDKIEAKLDQLIHIVSRFERDRLETTAAEGRQLHLARRAS